MPTTYAHDLFGQKVYRQLPDQVKEIIRKNGELYRIGLHGPDIFFYYFIFKNHVSSVGYRMHKEKARAFCSFIANIRRRPACKMYLLQERTAYTGRQTPLRPLWR